MNQDSSILQLLFNYWIQRGKKKIFKKPKAQEEEEERVYTQKQIKRKKERRKSCAHQTDFIDHIFVLSFISMYEYV